MKTLDMDYECAVGFYHLIVFSLCGSPGNGGVKVGCPSASSTAQSPPPPPNQALAKIQRLLIRGRKTGALSYRNLSI